MYILYHIVYKKSSSYKKLEKVTTNKKVDEKTVKGINFFDKNDEKILLFIANGNFTVAGLRAKNLKDKFLELKPWKISSILARFKKLGLIKKVANLYKYYLSALGRDVVIAGLHLKNQVLIPALAKA